MLRDCEPPREPPSEPLSANPPSEPHAEIFPPPVCRQSARARFQAEKIINSRRLSTYFGRHLSQLFLINSATNCYLTATRFARAAYRRDRRRPEFECVLSMLRSIASLPSNKLSERFTSLSIRKAYAKDFTWRTEQ